MSGGSGQAASGDSDAALNEDARRRIRARASPEGIVTILFTDVVESTRLRQRLGDDAAQDLFREHNRVLRAQMEKHDGHEVKSTGDGFMVAFGSMVGALACAIDIQRAIAEHNREHPGQGIQVRIGLNCGQVIKEEGDFFGSAVVIAARIGDLAKGGQILVSEMVRGLAGTWRGIRYDRYGRRHLKGLEGSYVIWAVPWREAETKGLARLWTSAPYRLTGLAVLAAAIGGGVAGALLLSGNGGENGRPQGVATPQEITTHLVTEAELQRVSGDCVSEDLVYRGTSESDVTGDISGRQTTTIDVTLYAGEGCQLGINSASFTIADSSGNTLSGTAEGPISASRLLEASAASTVSAVIITDGTGIYEGASGQGTCTSLGVNTFNPDGSVTSHAESDCAYELATAGAAGATPEPVIVQVGTSATEVTVFASSVDLPNTMAMVVLYRNTREDTQKGLSLRLPVPQGAQILAAARGEEQPVAAGERIWRLPDLPPGALERFEFTLQLLAAETPAVSLIVELEGEGFEQPVSSHPVAIKVTQ